MTVDSLTRLRAQIEINRAATVIRKETIRKISRSLPADFTVKAGDLSRVEGWGIFGGRTDLIAEIDEASRTVKIVD